MEHSEGQPTVSPSQLVLPVTPFLYRDPSPDSQALNPFPDPDDFSGSRAGSSVVASGSISPASELGGGVDDTDSVSVGEGGGAKEEEVDANEEENVDGDEQMIWFLRGIALNTLFSIF